MSKKIRVLVVDDSALVREIFTNLLNEDDEIEVIATAVDVQDARQKIKTLNPDIVTLDIEMPGMDGISFLEKIMTLRPTPVIMVSTLTQRGTEQTIRALEIGAIDCIGKPFATEQRETLPLLKNQLISKVKIAAKANLKINKIIVDNGDKKYEGINFAKDKLIAIGSSTGGVEAIRTLLESMPAEIPPIVIVQHMPEGFTRSFAARISATLGKNMQEARDGQVLEFGKIYIAPGNCHLKIHQHNNNYISMLSNEAPHSGHRPSVDILFDSIAANVDCSNVIAAILTGMGKDGASGMLKIREKGAYTIGQSEDSCIVYGMPKAAKNINAVTLELPIEKIGCNILDKCKIKN